MKKSYDNIIFSLQKAGGVSVYWFELLKRFKLNGVQCFELDNDNVFSSQLNLITRRESRIPLKILRYLPFQKNLPAYSIFHSSYYRVSLQKNIANVTTVHDFTYEYFTKGFRQKVHTWQKSFAIRHSAGIVCVSENTKRDLLKFFPDLDPSRIQVIYNGVGEEFLPKKDFIDNFLFDEIVGKKFVIFIGDRSAYKNFDRVVETVKQFPELSLVIVGGKKLSDNENLMLDSLKGRYYSYRGVASEALNWLYNHAFCLLYPSSYEGFGIPVLEAMKVGCPVISTNISSIPEVAGDAALLVDQPTVFELSEKVQLLQDEKLRNDLIEKGFIQAEKFSWNKCFEETVEFYEKVWQREFGDKN